MRMPRGENHKGRKRDGGRFTPRRNPITRSETRGRGDVFSSTITGLGGHNSKTGCDQWSGETQKPHIVLENIYGFRGLVRRLVEQEPSDATSKGFGITGLTPEQQTENRAFNRRRKFLRKLAQLRSWARKYGGAGAYMQIFDGRPDEEPVDMANIKRLGQITVFDRWDLAPSDYATSLTTGDHLVPTFYTLNTVNQKKVHRSRMMIMQGIVTTPREMQMNGGWGIGVIDATWKSLRDFFTTNSYLAESVTRSTQGVIKMPALEGSLLSCNKEAIEERMESLAMWMGALGDIALTADETYEIHHRGMAGFKEAQSVFVDALVADNEIPRSVLMGQVVGGLNSGEFASEWQGWSSYLGGQQIRVYDEHVERWHDLSFAAENGPIAANDVPDNWCVEWPAIWEPSITDVATAVSQIATAAATLVQNGMISPKEGRNNALIQEVFPPDPNATFEASDAVGAPSEVDDDEAASTFGVEGEDDDEAAA